MMNDQDYLIHYGVLGMKWGVRKKKVKESISKTKKSAKEQIDKTKKVVKKYNNSRKNYSQKISSRRRNKYKDLSKLSDNELRARINRMQLERQYSSLLRDQKYAVAMGKNVNDDILYKNGNQVVSQVIKKGMKKAVKLV